MLRRLIFLFAVACALGFSVPAAQAQNVICATAPAGDSSNKCASTQFVQSAVSGASSLLQNYIFVGNASNVAAGVPMSGDCAIVSAGIVICLKTNGVSFGTAAVQNTGTSGATLPFLNGNNGWSGTNTYSGDALFASGRPWCDVRAKGATGDGHTDDAGAVQACVTAVQSFGSGGTVYFPASNGPYCIKSMINITGVPVVFQGENQNISVSSCAADITVFKLNAPNSAVVDLTIYGKGVTGLPTADTVFGASNPTLWVAPLCNSCLVNHVKAQGGSYVLRQEGADFKVEASDMGSSYGSAVVYVASGGWFKNHNAFDQSWPVSLPAYPLTANAWAATTGYTTGQVVSTGGYYIQCLTSGTSGGTAPALKNYGTSITDGSAVWLLVAPTTYYGIQADTGASEVGILQQDLSGPFTAGLAMTNTLAGTAPTYVSIGTGSVISQVLTAGVYAIAGSDLVVDGLHIGGGLLSSSYGIVTSNAFAGKIKAVNNTILSGGTAAISIAAGTNSIIANNDLSANSASGVLITPNINDFAISSNTCDSTINICVAVQAGTSNHYAIYGNINAGVIGSMVSDGGTGTDKTIITTAGLPPTITAGCNGAGSSIGTGSTNARGWLTGQTAATTTCTITFGAPAYTTRPACAVSGEQSAILTMTPSTATLVVTFASTANYKFDWICPGQ